MAKFRITGRVEVDFVVETDILDDANSLEVFKKDVAKLVTLGSLGARNASNAVGAWLDTEEILDNGSQVEFQIDEVEEADQEAGEWKSILPAETVE